MNMNLAHYTGWATPLPLSTDHAALARALGHHKDGHDCLARRQGKCPGLEFCHDCAWAEGTSRQDSRAKSGARPFLGNSAGRSIAYGLADKARKWTPAHACESMRALCNRAWSSGSLLGAAVLLSVAVFLAQGAVAPIGLGEQHLIAGEMDIHYSVAPARTLLGYPPESAERPMHGGVALGNGEYHVGVALFDAKTKQRIDNAEVSARVYELALPIMERELQPMPMSGAITYGNYFKMDGQGPYRVELEIRRPNSLQVTTAAFEYSRR